MLERLFQLAGNATTARQECLAGLTTFLTMAYILAVNPLILSAAGMDQGAVFVATCLAAAFGTLVMAFAANYPVALAPGMGLNAYFAYVVVPQLDGNWQVALACVFFSGLLFFALSLTPARAWLVNAIPNSLKIAIAAGIGFFLALIAMQNAGLVTDHPATMVTLGDVTRPELWLAGFGIIAIVALTHFRVMGAILIGVLGVTALAVLFGMQSFEGVAGPPPSVAPTFLQMDVAGALSVGLVTVIFTFFLVDLLDTTGTLIGVTRQAGLVDEKGHLPRLRPALLADSSASAAGALFGTSTTTAYIESAAGVAAGGRTGLTALVVAVLFLLALFLAPLFSMVPVYATAPALFFVAVLMMKNLADVDWQDATEALPAAITALAMPLTFSIATGIGLGFIAYVAVKLATARWREISPAVALIAVAFAIKLALDAAA